MRAFLNRPDHLTRAAMELSTLSEVERTARDLSLAPNIVVTSISTGAQRSQPSSCPHRKRDGSIWRLVRPSQQSASDRSEPGSRSIATSGQVEASNRRSAHAILALLPQRIHMTMERT